MYGIGNTTRRGQKTQPLKFSRAVCTDIPEHWLTDVLFVRSLSSWYAALHLIRCCGVIYFTLLLGCWFNCVSWNVVCAVSSVSTESDACACIVYLFTICVFIYVLCSHRSLVVLEVFSIHVTGTTMLNSMYPLHCLTRICVSSVCDSDTAQHHSQEWVSFLLVMFHTWVLNHLDQVYTHCAWCNWSPCDLVSICIKVFTYTHSGMCVEIKMQNRRASAPKSVQFSTSPMHHSTCPNSGCFVSPNTECKLLHCHLPACLKQPLYTYTHMSHPTITSSNPQPYPMQIPFKIESTVAYGTHC